MWNKVCPLLWASLIRRKLWETPEDLPVLREVDLLRLGTSDFSSLLYLSLFLALSPPPSLSLKAQWACCCSKDICPYSKSHLHYHYWSVYFLQLWWRLWLCCSLSSERKRVREGEEQELELSARTERNLGYGVSRQGGAWMCPLILSIVWMLLLYS